MRNHAPWTTILSHCLHQFHENDLFTPAAAMSYFGLLTLFPTLLVLLYLSNYFDLGNEMLTRAVEAYPGSREFLRTTIRSLRNVNAGVIVTCVVVTLWAGSWVFSVIERAINRLWGTLPRAFLHGRALTAAMSGGAGLLCICSVTLKSLLVALSRLAAPRPPPPLERVPLLAVRGHPFWPAVFAVLSLLVTVALFTLVYRFMPSGRVTLRDSVPGALLAGLLWEAAKYIFAWSLHYFHYDQIYGSVGAVVAVLTWSYVSSLILLLGAQLTVVFHQEHEMPQPALVENAGGEQVVPRPAAPAR